MGYLYYLIKEQRMGCGSDMADGWSDGEAEFI